MSLDNLTKRAPATAPPKTPEPVAPAPRRVPRPGRTVRLVFLAIVATIMLVPLYVLVVNAFKSQSQILTDPFGLPTSGTLAPLRRALQGEEFDLVRGYAVTLLFVVCVNVLSIALAGPVAYVIARSPRRRFRALMLFFLAGTFIPSQVLVIPVVYVLKTVGLMGTVRGFVLFETVLTLPFSVFLYAGYITTVPRALDEAAALDGCGRNRTFWRIVFPLMRPVVATMVILNTFSVWNDFVNPQIILGPGSGLYTVTTGVYAAVSQYQTDYTVVFPTLLLAVAPLIVFFVFMQRHIISGLAAGATRG
ncbi:carbohydrate ABC transporter permease [Streptomyces longispororuber]|uniref:carbohydrate ABC transporter permease n=1 Tax=Streptomyces longispororuber TaxID=68230 RepID=UPI00210E672A|nr:carbohydrate ABC transporter permease [Streptomyces longispororuber]MCQ4208376.1 carbohydrate ABC transporter permease [Streptomyces longispororuber]